MSSSQPRKVNSVFTVMNRVPDLHAELKRFNVLVRFSFPALLPISHLRPVPCPLRLQPHAAPPLQQFPGPVYHRCHTHLLDNHQEVDVLRSGTVTRGTIVWSSGSTMH